MPRLLGAVGAVAALGASCLAWGLVEAHWFKLRHAQLPVLPPGGPTVRVLHIADLHLMPGQRDKLRFVESLAHLSPDLVINTGDNISSPEAIGALHDALSALSDVPGGFVFGSNDFVAPRFKNPLNYLLHGRSTPDDHPVELPTPALRAMLVSHGWADLNEQRTLLEVCGYRFELRGTGDAHHDRDDYSSVAGPPQPDADVALGVTHAPYLRILDAMTADGVDAIFAGHTHGGQVCVPGYGALITNCDIEPARVKGPSTHSFRGRTAQLHISAGLGTSPYAPYRFFCRPEATLVTLTSRH